MKRSFNIASVMQLQPESASMQLNHAIAFCHDWINGQTHFTFHTSGSTGTPKKVDLDRSQLEISARSTIDAIGLTPSEKIFVCLNTYLIAGTMMLVRGLMLSCEMYVDDPTSDPLKHLPADHDMTFASFVPMQLHDLAADDPQAVQKLNRFRNILVGGGPVNSTLEEKLGQLSCNVYHTYGMTETVSHIALRKIGRERFFTALPGIELKTDDRNCLCIRGPVTKNEWLVTNDIVDLAGDRQFTVSGRADEMVNSGGMKILPSRIEARIDESLKELGIPVNDLFVAGEPDDKWGEKLVAVFCAEPFTASQEEALISLLRQKLPSYEIPKQFYFLPAFLTTAGGKTDKKNTLLKLGR